MASIDPSLVLDPNEQKRVSEINEILKHPPEINIDIPPVSIFQIPETTTTNKPEAYKPQQIGFGPYHHFQLELYSKMEQKKLMVVQKVLQHNKIEDFNLTVVEKVNKLVPVIRACYDVFLQQTNASMALPLAIDGLYLLDMFQTYRDHEVDSRRRLLAQDIMMVENQIPFMLLKEIDEALHPSTGSTIGPSIYRSFCEIHSPLEICQPFKAPPHAEHLLEYMYFSIINNTYTPYTPPAPSSIIMTPSASSIITNATNFILKVPEKEISELYNRTITTLQNFSRKKITIPSASNLHNRSGFHFHAPWMISGITEIRFDKENIYLPCLTLNSESEVILRNLVAYETLTCKADYLPLTKYIGWMCELIVDVEDVKLLKNAGIIKGDLSDDEVVKIFVSMSTLTISLNLKPKQKPPIQEIPKSSLQETSALQDKSSLQETIDEVKKVYENEPEIKIYVFMQKLANWLLIGLKAIGSFVGSTWKIIAFIVSIVTIFMLTYQAYCDVYGCDKTNVTLLPHASS